MPERNPKGNLVELTLYQRPGFVPQVQGPVATVRGLYRPTTSIGGFAVIGQGVFFIDPNWVMTKIGTLQTPLNTPVSFIDNGFDILLVDNSQFGYQIHLGTNAFTQVVDPTGAFVGATRVDVIDGFVVGNNPGTATFFSTLDNVLTFDALYQANKNNYPDLLAAVICNRHQILLLGTLTSEIWYDAGNPFFPFAELPGSSIQHGTCAPFSCAAQDISAYWLGQDLQGQGVVFAQRGYETKRISNHALEVQIRKMAQVGIISDAIGYCYQQDGHVYYVLTFPSGDQTWVFDEAIGDPEQAWHQRAWTDENGLLHRDRSNCCANINGKVVVGDWQNGTIYALDPEIYHDTVNGVPTPTSYIRTFPHWNIAKSMVLGGQLAAADGKRMQINQFIADIECGTGPLDANGNPATVGMRLSLDRGRTFGNRIDMSAGAPGEYETSPKWAPLGIARDPVIELEYNIDGPAALNGGWVEAQIANT